MLSRSRETMDRPVGGQRLHLDLHQGAATPIVSRDRAALPRRRDAPRKGRRAQGARKLSLPAQPRRRAARRSEEHTSELQSLMRIYYAVFGLKKKKQQELNIKKR